MGLGSGPVEGTVREPHAIVVAVVLLLGVVLAPSAAATDGTGDDVSSMNESSAGTGPDGSNQPPNATEARTTPSADEVTDASSNGSEDATREPDKETVEDPDDEARGTGPLETIPERGLPPIEAPIQQPGTPSGETGSGNGPSAGPSILSTEVPGQIGQALGSTSPWLWTAGLAIAGVLAAGTWKQHRGASAHRSGDGTSEPSAEQVGFQGVVARPVPGGDDGREPIEHPGAPGSLLLGRRALDDGRPGLAVGWFQAAVRLEPSSAKAHLCLGVGLRASDRPERAAAALAQACDLDPTDARARLHLARALVEDGKPAQAVSALRPLVGTDPRVDQALAEDEALAPLRDDPRFLALLGRLHEG